MAAKCAPCARSSTITRISSKKQPTTLSPLNHASASNEPWENSLEAGTRRQAPAQTAEHLPAATAAASLQTSSSLLRDTIRATPARVLIRFGWFGLELVRAALAYPWEVVARPEGTLRLRRAKWLHRTCRRLLRVIGLARTWSAAMPSHGLLISNHLSYIDILLLSAAGPCVFVAKSEVRSWPIFGWFARKAGTVFIERRKRSDVFRASQEMTAALNEGALVVLFPEGTSSNGETVLPFKPSLLAPAAGQAYPIYAAFIRYGLRRGSVRDEVCYWGDMTLLPHLLNLLGKDGLTATCSVAPYRRQSSVPADRKELAHQLHSQVLRLSGVL